MPHSLQCPRCKGAVQVADDARGTRVQCPHCEQPFLVPGFASSSSDDDDWLKLDDEVPPPKPAVVKPASKQPAAPGLSAERPNAEVHDPFSGDPFGDDPAGNLPAGSSADSDDGLPPFEFLPLVSRPSSSVGIPALDEREDLPLPPAHATGGRSPAAPSKSSSPAPTTVKTPPTAASPELMTEYRVNCLNCGTMTYAKASQAGKSIKCPDCYAPIKVPPPPRVPKKVTIDMESAETFQFENTGAAERPADPFIKSAEELLRNAEKQNETEPEPNFDTPSIVEWAKNVFGIFLDPGVLAHWLILSVFAGIPTYVALAFESRILILGLFPAGIVFGVVVLGCGFAIMQSLANEEERVSEWPAFDPGEWFGQMMVATAAVAFAAAPSYGAAYMAFGHSLAAVAITMIAIYVLFPFLILSILDMQSITTPFSPEVARSITKCEESWGGFYFTSGVLFFALFLMFVLASSFPPPVRGVACLFLGVAATFIYFAMIGRLAFAIGQAVNDKPMKNDIDRSKKTDAV